MIDLLNWPGGLAAAVLCAAAGWFVLGLTRDHRDTLGVQRAVFLTAFALRFAASLVIYVGGLVTVLHDEDSSAWIGGVVLMQRWTNGTNGGSGLADALAALITTGNLGYQYLLGAFFTATHLVGRMPAMTLTAAIGAGGVVFVYRTARVVATERAARWVAAVITVMPLMIIWSSQTLKEPVVIATEAVALYACLRLALGSRAPRHLWLAIAAMLFVVPFRFYIAFVLAPGLLMGVWRGPRSLAARLAATAGVVLLLAHVTRETIRHDNPGLDRVQHFREAVSPGGSAVGAQGPNQNVPLATGEEARALLANARNGVVPPLEATDVETGRAAGARTPGRPPVPQPLTLDVRNPWQLPLVVAIGSTYALFAPFPWQFSGGSLRFLLTAPDMLLWWIIFFGFVARGVWRAVRDRWREVAPLLVFLLLLGGLYSLMFGNVGIAYRQRAQLVPVLLTLTAAGLAPQRRFPA